MYGKLFASMYDGTLGTRGPWQALVTFQQLIILSDPEGVVDMTPEALSRRTTIPLEIITQGLQLLEQPDPDSRSPDEDGRRIVRLSDSRSWGWRIVNYARYRKIRTSEERRDYMRQYQRERRAKDAVSTVNRPSTPVSKLTNSSKQEAVSRKQKHKNPNPLSGDKAPDVAQGKEKGGKADKRTARAAARRAIEYLNSKAGTKFQTTEANLKLAAGRMLYDGASEPDLLAVVDLKVAEAARGEFDRKYLRPATLWGAEKFSQYVGQVGAQPPNKPPAPPQPRVLLIAPDESVRKDLGELSDFPAGAAAGDVAKGVARAYSRTIERLGAKYIDVSLGAERSRFSVEELKA